MEGEGTFSWHDGKIYKGSYKDDKKDGFGTLEWPDGRKYVGNWKNGKQHGDGEYFDPNINSWKKGKWKVGKKVEFVSQNNSAKVFTPDAN